MKRRTWIISALGVALAGGVVVLLATLHSGSSAPATVKADSNGVRNENVAWVKKAIAKGALVLDVRNDNEWSAGRIANSVHIPLAQVQDRAGELPKGRLIVAVCHDGGRSYKAVYALTQQGYNAVNLEDGLKAWVAAGLPVVADAGAPGQIIS